MNTAPTPTSGRSDRRILIGLGREDERAEVMAALDAAGHDVAGVNSVELMMALREALPFDLVVVDAESASALGGRGRRALPVLLVCDPEHPEPEGDWRPRDFILRPLSVPELRRRVAALLAAAEREPAPSGAAASGDMVVRPDSRQLIVGDEAIQLRPREARVLSLLLSRRGEVVKTDTLLEEVWGPGPSSSRNLVEAQISRLRSKLRGTEAAGAIITVSGVGYLIR